MRNLFKSILVAAAVTASASMAFNVSASTGKLDEILQKVQQERQLEGRVNQQREQAFISARADQQRILNEAKRALVSQETRGERLQKQYADNDILIAQKEQELDSAQGTLGELFGMVRGSASDAIGIVGTSIVSAQHPNREQPLRGLAAATELPTIPEMEDLWVALLTEMTESGKISRFDAEVVNLDGGTSNQRVTRFGSFHVTTDRDYLYYNADTNQLQPLGRDPIARVHSSVSDFHNSRAGALSSLFIDPTKGNSILRLNQQRSTLMEYYHQGKQVGYLITVLLFIGLLIAIERFVVLSLIGSKIRSQLKNLSKPSSGNPLGRILKVYHDNKSADVENLELKLDEAILRETPKIDRGIGMIKLFAAVAPLMGLLGTVIGMIMTFQTITLYGTGDPKLMAGDISLALVTTALGLIAALPLIFAHSIVASKAKGVMHVLDEQSAGIVAAHAEKEKA